LTFAAALYGGCADELPGGSEQGVDKTAPTPSDGVASSEARPGAKQQVLAEVELEHGKVTFHRLDTPDGYTRIAVSEQVSNRAGATPFSRLATDELTHLELFRAIAPDEVPHPLLEALHAAEAEDLGRASLDVREASLDLDSPLEKWSPAECQNWVFEDPPDNCGVRTWTNGRKADNVSGSVGLHVGQYWSYATTKPVTLGICNDSDATIQGRVGIDYGGDSSSAYTYWGWATVTVGSAWRWYDFRQVHTCTSCSGDICSITHGCYRPSRYRVDGSSPSGKRYHLYTAEAHQPNCYDL
jgi:hypothetical protein